MGRQGLQRRHFHQIILAPSHQLGLDQCADFFKPLVVEVGGVGSVNHIQRLFITSGGGELFKPRLRDKRHLDVGSSGKLKKTSLSSA